MTIRDFQKNQKNVKLEILFNESVENSGESVKNRIISGNPYYFVQFKIVLSEFVLSGDPL